MVISEKKTNIEKIVYGDYNKVFIPFVKLKSLYDFFITNSECILITFCDTRVVEAYRVFQYVCYRSNHSTRSYCVYELVNQRKKEYIIRVIEWNRNKAKEKIKKEPYEVELEIESEVYYASGYSAVKIRKMLGKLRKVFKGEFSMTKEESEMIEQSVFMEYGGFSINFQWNSPYVLKQAEQSLLQMVQDISELKFGKDTEAISQIEILYDVALKDYEKQLFCMDKISIEQ